MKDENNTIVVCEPLCWGEEHAEINSSILLSLREAWPHARILFLAELTHCAAIKQVLSDYNCANDIVDMEAISIADRGLSNSQRIKIDWKVVAKIYQHDFYQQASHILFLSASSGIIFATKFQHRKKVKNWIVMHGGVDDLRKKRIRFFKPFYYGNALHLNNQADVQYLLLGKYIEENLFKIAPKLAQYAKVLEHPGIFSDTVALEENNAGLHSPCFGSIGVVSRWKNSGAFLDLAESIHQKGLIQAKFCFVGALMETDLANRIKYSSTVEPMPQKVGAFLSRSQINNAIENLDYAVFLYEPDSYVLKASGAIIDAFRFAKPVIAIRSAMAESFFDTYGDIGYLCSDQEELKNTIIGLITKPDPVRYKKQQLQMIDQRKKFGLAATAARFKDLWGD